MYSVLSLLQSMHSKEDGRKQDKKTKINTTGKTLSLVKILQKDKKIGVSSIK